MKAPWALAALAAALLVAVVGIGYTAVRDRSDQSVATVVLSPSSEDPGLASSVLESFERSGTLGTYVELMASDDTTAEARARDVDVTVRAVPDTRTIRLTATGDAQDVQPALRSVIAATEAKQSELADLFELRVLERPSTPEASGPGAGLLLVTTLVLAAFAALATAVIVRRLEPAGPRR